MLTPEITKAIEAAVQRAVANIAPADPFLTTKEVARTINCHEDTASRLIREGKIRSVGSGLLRRVPQSAIMEFMSADPKGRAAR